MSASRDELIDLIAGMPEDQTRGASEIAMFDRRRFPAITPKSGGHCTLLPETVP
ncbi:hypothetical protein [Promicromonospora umidemergens]|uniref:hypothetical protein n=1 Tax=Promicromonospora umidemergens TaxID=629679 RepID=UPI0020A5701E|nr:hypothetical protein [Promicromonospora umidemergens]